MFEPHIPFIAGIEAKRRGDRSITLMLRQSRILGGGEMALNLHAEGDNPRDTPDMLAMLETAIRDLREREARAVAANKREAAE